MSKIKVIYIDDEEINLIILRLNLSKTCDVYTGISGYEGLELLNEHPDTKVIISDMKMPGMNGLEFIKNAKEKYPDKKYYILTGFEITDEIKHALETRLIQKYFRKPFDIKEIEATIAEI
jgi:response regulator RpfG family c-di-GMP phosphodiesterase